MVWINRTAAEIHLVHFNSKYSSEEEAQKFPDGLAVLAVMIEVFNHFN